MPNTKSAKKRLRQSLEQRARNRAVKSTIRTTVRKIRDAVAAGQIQEAEAHLASAAKRFDQAAAKRVIHVNKASRLKSRLQHFVKTAKAATAK